MIMCLMCKQIRDLIWDGSGMNNKLICVFELCLLEREDNVRRSSQRLRYPNDSTKNSMLQQYQHWNIIAHGVEKHRFEERFDDWNGVALEYCYTPTMSMTGLVSLDVLSSSVPVHQFSPSLFDAISRMVPNLRELDLSNVVLEPAILQVFSRQCPQLEIIR